MLSGLILERYGDMGSAYTCRRLSEEASSLGMSAVVTGVMDTVVSEDGSLYNRGVRMEGTDFVLNRYKHGHVKDEINGLARRAYNPLDAFNTYVDKYEQIRRLNPSSVGVPRSMLVNRGTVFDTVVEVLSAPFVLKGLRGSEGREVFLVGSEEEMRSALLSCPGEEFLCQEYIGEMPGRDMRVFSVRGNPVAVMERYNPDGFRANVAQGARVKRLDVREEVRVTCSEIYEQTGLDFAGVDLLYGRDGLVFCEVNVMPGIKGMESATGVNIARLVMETVAGDLS